MRTPESSAEKATNTGPAPLLRLAAIPPVPPAASPVPPAAAATASTAPATAAAAATAIPSTAVPAYPLTGFLSVHLSPGPIEYSPVQYGTISGSSLVAAAGSTGEAAPLGYIKIVIFSSTAPEEVRNAIKELQVRKSGEEVGVGVG